MYAYITGTVEYVGDSKLVIDNSGIGYDLYVSNNCLTRLGIKGETVKVYTYLNVREDEMSLFGFYSLEEKEFFLKLITVSGIGPKLALSVLSGLSLENLKSIILSGDVKTLSTVKGVGKKTAERIILELRGSMEDSGSPAAVASGVSEDSLNDAVLALINLGISRQEAYSAVIKASAETSDTGELVAKALRSMYR